MPDARFLPLGLLALAAALAACASEPPSGPPLRPAPPVPTTVVFQRYCAFCHGQKGRGDGPAAARLRVKPRDFTRGLFKFRTTRPGDPPSDEDLFRVISNGLAGTPMVAWDNLPEADRRALVEDVKRLASFVDEETGERVSWFDRRGKGQPLAVPLEPPEWPSWAARGAQVYVRLECAKCHGDEGCGDGPSAVDARDDWGQPARPRDFGTGAFKGGGTARDLFLRTLVGIEGTPMPAYGRDVLPDEERWALVRYVRALVRVPPPPVRHYPQ